MTDHKSEGSEGEDVALFTIGLFNLRGAEYKKIPIYELPFTFGSADDCNLVIKNNEDILSEHATITSAKEKEQNNSFIIKCSGEVHINAEKIKKTKKLSSGDTLLIGPMKNHKKFMFYLGDQSEDEEQQAGTATKEPQEANTPTKAKKRENNQVEKTFIEFLAEEIKNKKHHPSDVSS
ncbi:chfr [Acrasis kona]|uniref:Chfr n=1 Tax=Acrasis kona TaxID=1008807 RepID=A0AAW2ZKB2_9EUKA